MEHAPPSMTGWIWSLSEGASTARDIGLSDEKREQPATGGLSESVCALMAANRTSLSCVVQRSCSQPDQWLRIEPCDWSALGRSRWLCSLTMNTNIFVPCVRVVHREPEYKHLRCLCCDEASTVLGLCASRGAGAEALRWHQRALLLPAPVAMRGRGLTCTKLVWLTAMLSHICCTRCVIALGSMACHQSA